MLDVSAHSQAKNKSFSWVPSYLGDANASGILVLIGNKILRRHKNGIAETEKYVLDLRRKKGSRRKFKLKFNDVKVRVKAVHFSLQKPLHAIFSLIGIVFAHLHHYLQIGVLNKSGSAVKSMLTDINKV